MFIPDMDLREDAPSSHLWAVLLLLLQRLFPAWQIICHIYTCGTRMYHFFQNGNLGIPIHFTEEYRAKRLAVYHTCGIIRTSFELIGEVWKSREVPR